MTTAEDTRSQDEELCLVLNGRRVTLAPFTAEHVIVVLGALDNEREMLIAAGEWDADRFPAKALVQVKEFLREAMRTLGGQA